VLGDEPGTCEFAISVVNAWAGAGLGGALLGALVTAARARGLATMEGFVLAENRAMLRLAQRLGFAVKRQAEDPTVRTCTLQLSATPPR
jgi:acetyltransferase